MGTGFAGGGLGLRPTSLQVSTGCWDGHCASLSMGRRGRGEKKMLGKQPAQSLEVSGHVSHASGCLFPSPIWYEEPGVPACHFKFLLSSSNTHTLSNMD